VLLYELLAGSTRFDAKELTASGIDAIRKAIREKEPQPPSTQLTQVLVAPKQRGGLLEGLRHPPTAAKFVVSDFWSRWSEAIFDIWALKKTHTITALFITLLGGVTHFVGAAEPGAPAFRPVIPKTWDDAAMAEPEIPPANSSASPKQVPAGSYYRIPVRPIHASYPVYHPGRWFRPIVREGTDRSLG
jgi:hypothetical protein